MAENYIVINGKRAELTEEQLKQLGIEMPKANLFERVKCGPFYSINSNGSVDKKYDANWDTDTALFNVANYCTDKEMMEQRALHETLNRLLWRYSMEHEGDKINLHERYYIFYEFAPMKYNVSCDYYCHCFGVPYFYTKQIARNAIKEIIEPFMAAHPEFKW